MPDDGPKPKCFIVMPITTPPERLKDYGDNADHFSDVLEVLFIPAVEAAGFEAVPPKFEGSPVIQGAIIKHLTEADMVLCDMSALNPNAFFELGVRSALDKPVAMVRDHVTPRIPFDVGTISAHTYDGTLYGKHIEEERRKLAAHIRAAAANGGHNELWRVFGIQQVAEDPPEGSQLDAIETMLRQLVARQELDAGTFGAWGSYRPGLRFRAAGDAAYSETPKLLFISDLHNDPPDDELVIEADAEQDSSTADGG